MTGRWGRAIGRCVSCVCCALLLPPPAALAADSGETSPQAEGGWFDGRGQPAANTDAMKSVDGFGGWLVITPDDDWADKWATPSDTVPYFSEASSVEVGESITILTFYINPGVDVQGKVRIVCDLRVTRPDGSLSIDEQGLECVSGAMPGNPRHVRLTPAILRFVGEPDDPGGTWTVAVTLTDAVRGTEVPLTTEFELVRNE